MASHPGVVCPLNTSGCTFATCPAVCAHIQYAPSVSGNLTYCLVLAVILFGQIWQGIWYQTWGFLAGMVCGLSMEVVGYLGRLLLHNNQFSTSSFTIYLVDLTIGPAFLSASIYLCLSRIIVVYGASYSRFSPRTIAVGFMVSDFISLVLQSIGGGIITSVRTESGLTTGRDIIIAGLIFQVCSLATFMALWADFAWRSHRAGDEMRNLHFRDLRVKSRRFRYFQWALGTAVMAIFIRSVYRVVELWQGFGGKIANNQTLFMIFEGPMIIIATGLLLIWHPGYAFNDQWHDAAWSLRKEKGTFTILNGREMY